MRPIAKRHGASVAQVALAWLLSKDSVTSIHLGATKLAQLDDNLAAIYPTWFIERLVDADLEKALVS